MSPIKKVAVFLMMIGMEKGRSIIEFMDNGEIKVVVSEIQKLTTVSQDMQKSVWAEFKALGYEDAVKSVEALTIIRFLWKQD